MKTITVLSGKGGVGKSSLTASLALLLKEENKRMVAVDCDVDAPNLALILGVEEFQTSEKIQTSEKAKIIAKTCPQCKKLIDVCVFGAISWDEKNNQPKINRFLCEGCGACQLAFPQGTVKMEKVQNAFINTAQTMYGFPIISGQLKMGESGSGKIVAEVKQKAEAIAKKQQAEITLIDSSPGIGCPVIASIQGSDFVVAITEPTPSAFSDLKRVLKVVEHFQIPYGIVINKYDINPQLTIELEKFARQKAILLGKISYDKKFVESLVQLTPPIVGDEKIEKELKEIMVKVNQQVFGINKD